MGITGLTGGSNNYPSYGMPKGKDDVNTASENAAKSSGRNTGTAKTGTAQANGSTGSTAGKKRTVAEYTQYLQEKFSYMNKNTTMEGVPTIVSVSPAFIAQCANDPEKAKFLEENLAALPDCAKMGVAYAGARGSTVTHYGYYFDAEGNISMTMSGSSDPDGKIAKENAERKAKEVREKAEKLEEKRAAQKAEAKKTEAKKAAEKLTEQLMAKITEQPTPAGDAETAVAAGEERHFTVSETAVFTGEAVPAGSHFSSYC